MVEQLSTFGVAPVARLLVRVHILWTGRRDAVRRKERLRARVTNGSNVHTAGDSTTMVRLRAPRTRQSGASGTVARERLDRATACPSDVFVNFQAHLYEKMTAA